jgi:hypothetical protein
MSISLCGCVFRVSFMPADKSAPDHLKVFISYSRKDLALANAVADALEARGMDVLIDRRDLPYGEQWQIELGELIRNADSVVWLVSRASCVSRWCNWELGEVMRLGKRLVPVAVEDLTSKDMPEAIGRVQLLPYEGTFEMDKHLGTLQSVLETDMAWLKESTRLADRARQWIAKGRRKDLLLGGAQLRDAQAWLDGRRATAPAPAAQTLELILASRRARTRRRYWLAGGPFAAALALLLAYVTVMWVGAKVLPDTNVAMGDILNRDGEPGFDASYLGCRIGCMLNAFGSRCVGFSYDKSSPLPVAQKQDSEAQAKSQTQGRGNPDLETRKLRCFPKYAIDYSWNPSQTGTEAFDTEVMLSIFGEAPDPKQSNYRLNWYRSLTGEPVDLQDMLRIGDVTYTLDDKSGRVSTTFRSSECQQKCIDLGDKCRGFAYTSGATRCELFKSVKGILREAGTNRPVYMPGTISGCDDPDAAVDPVTKQSECPARGGNVHRASVR